MQTPPFSTKPGKQVAQVPTNWQVAQLVIPQDTQFWMPFSRNPGLQVAHSLGPRQTAQFYTEQESQLFPLTFGE